MYAHVPIGSMQYNLLHITKLLADSACSDEISCNEQSHRVIHVLRPCILLLNIPLLISQRVHMRVPTQLHILCSSGVCSGCPALAACRYGPPNRLSATVGLPRRPASERSADGSRCLCEPVSTLLDNDELSFHMQWSIFRVVYIAVLVHVLVLFIHIRHRACIYIIFSIVCMLMRQLA